jgi:hypothetical protein
VRLDFTAFGSNISMEDYHIFQHLARRLAIDGQLLAIDGKGSIALEARRLWLGSCSSSSYPEDLDHQEAARRDSYRNA